MKIVFLDSFTLNPGDLDLSSLMELGQVETFERTSPSKIVSRCKDAEIVITNKVKFSKETISQLPNLKFIQIAATGMNNVDLEFAGEKNILVQNVSGYSTSSVSQHVFAVLLSYFNQSATYFKESQNKEWSTKNDFSYWHEPILELKNKTFGVWGLGKIGQAVAKIALAFEMDVIAVNKYADTFQLEGVTNVSKKELIETSDIISLHTPLNDSTHEMINEQTLNRMKSSAIIVNTGRGQLIDENALAQALEEKVIAAALLDVLSSEPPPNDHVLLATPNCFITPHQAWGSLESRQRLLNGIVTNIATYQKK